MIPRILVVQHEPDGGADLMQATLEQGSELHVARPFLGETLPENLDGLDGLVVLGGEMGALDDERAPWLPSTRKIMGDAVGLGLPVLGICLGAQLLAAATGGRVERGAPGLEIGLVPVRPLEAASGDPFFGPVTGSGYEVSQYHYDCVAELPPDAELLVTGERYPVQGFRVGANAYGVQYHPEVSAAGFAGWVRSGGLPTGLDVLPAVEGAAEGQARLAHIHADSLINMAVTVATADRRSGSRDTLSR